MQKLLQLVFFFCTSFLLQAQKFHLRSGVGLSALQWYEKELTANFSSQLTFQKPGSGVLFLGELKTFGNVVESKVNPHDYVFIPLQNSELQGPSPVLDVNNLSSTYRGGSAEFAIQFNQKKHQNPYLVPEISIYSISFARKISTAKTQYVEEEKYGLHGLTGGLGICIPGNVKLFLKSKLFIPVYNNFTLYGRYIGVPYENSNQEINVSYRNALEISYKKFNWAIDFDIYKLGKSENLKSKTIPASTNSVLSLYLNYLF